MKGGEVFFVSLKMSYHVSNTLCLKSWSTVR